MAQYKTANVTHDYDQGLQVRLYDIITATIDSIKAFPPVSVPTRITTATTTVISAVPCWARVSIQNGTMGVTTIYNNTAASGDIKWTGIPTANTELLRPYVYFDTGLTVVTAAATEVFVEVVIPA